MDARKVALAHRACFELAAEVAGGGRMLGQHEYTGGVGVEAVDRVDGEVAEYVREQANDGVLVETPTGVNGQGGGLGQHDERRVLVDEANLTGSVGFDLVFDDVNELIAASNDAVERRHHFAVEFETPFSCRTCPNGCVDVGVSHREKLGKPHPIVATADRQPSAVGVWGRAGEHVQDALQCRVAFAYDGVGAYDDAR